MIRPWKTLASQLLIERKWLRVYQERVETGTGALIDEFHVVESPDWAATICVTTNHELVLVEQYRHGLGGLSLELPAGVIEDKEAVAEGAERELLEETGYRGSPAQLFWSTRPEPARGRSNAHFCIVRNAEEMQKQDLDDSEDLRVVLLPLRKLSEILKRMDHGLHIGALLYAQELGLLKRDS